MRDLNRRNKFARRMRTGRYLPLDYLEAYALWKGGGDLYEKAIPDRSVTPREVAEIPWTPVPERDDEET